MGEGAEDGEGWGEERVRGVERERRVKREGVERVEVREGEVDRGVKRGVEREREG